MNIEQAAMAALEQPTAETAQPVEEAKGKKKGSAKPPSAKGKSPKGAKGAPPPIVVANEGPTEDEKEKAAVKEKIRKEYIATLKKEGSIFLFIPLKVQQKLKYI